MVVRVKDDVYSVVSVVSCRVALCHGSRRLNRQTDRQIDR